MQSLWATCRQNVCVTSSGSIQREIALTKKRTTALGLMGDYTGYNHVCTWANTSVWRLGVILSNKLFKTSKRQKVMR